MNPSVAESARNLNGISETGASFEAIDFLQSVLVVDDNVFIQPMDSAVPPAGLGNDSLAEIFEPQQVFGSKPLAGTEHFETKVVVEGFADMGIWCTALAPSDSNQSDTARVSELARRTDVLILDWLIRPEGGSAGPSVESTSIGLITSVLLADEENGSRLRLICVYTGDRDLTKVESDVLTGLAKAFGEDASRAFSDRRLDFRHARIVLLSKAGGAEVPGIVPVDATHLASKVVQEFSDFVSVAILPRAALSALAAIRDRAHLVIRRFSGQLDEGLLSHSTFTSLEQAREFILGLIGSEFASIALEATPSVLTPGHLEAARMSRVDGKQSFHTWSWKCLFAEGYEDTTLKEVAQGPDTPVKNYNQAVGMFSGKNATNSRVPLMLDGSRREIYMKSRQIELGFSALSLLERDHRSSGSNVAPRLRLGSVVENNGKYWLCVQPVCDSVRLSGTVKFPFLELKPVHIGSDRIDVAVPLDDRMVALEFASMGMGAVHRWSFVPSKTTAEIQAERREGVWAFRSSGRVDLRWLGDIRQDKAQRIVQILSTGAAKIGLDEYDFFRGLSARG